MNLRGGAATVLSLYALATSLAAQSGQGELRLAVVDATGRPVAAAIRFTGEANQVDQSFTLPPGGAHTFQHLPFGRYRIRAAYSGLIPAESEIEIRSEIPFSSRITLSVQPIETQITVSDSGTLLDSSRVGAAYHVGEEALRDRPFSLPGRGLLDRIAAQPGWVLEANGVLHPRESEYDTQYVVDGFPVQDNRSPAFAPGLPADDVQSMTLLTGSFPAEYGRKLGGVVEVTTARDARPGLHGSAWLEGGSFNSVNGSVHGQYTAGRNTAALNADGFLTDRYLDPAVLQNYTNHGSGGGVTGSLERDASDAVRLRFSFSHRSAGLLVPNELLQQEAGQRQDRRNGESSGRFTYQQILSPSLLANIRVMGRDTSAVLWSNPFTTPIEADQDRGLRELYVNASLSGHIGRNEWKTGADASFAGIREAFGYRIVAYQVQGIDIFDPDTPAELAFRDHRQKREQSAYLQDQVHLGSLLLSAGVRFDHYRFLVNESAFSPRLGASWRVPRMGLVVRASYDRTFGTPATENLLLSSSRAATALNDKALSLPVPPSHGNYLEAGFSKTLGGRVRLDAAYFHRDLRNPGDDDVLLNTGVSFPISYRSALIRGVEAKLEAPRLGRFSGFISYANMSGAARFPVTGGLFLDDAALGLLQSSQRFPVTQDQRNTASGRIRAEISPRFWLAVAGSYGSGLPAEGIDNGQSREFLISQYSAAVISRVNFDRGRVRPSYSVDVLAGAELWKREGRSVRLQASVNNLTGHLNVINFASLFSGTAIAVPRSAGAGIRFDF
ncbi:MAG: TonB-dependent receptor [Acidobacteriota bacterium]|nr:TonB-dependent receptor [Acidobacteriota bacterium]